MTSQDGSLSSSHAKAGAANEGISGNQNKISLVKNFIVSPLLKTE